MEFMRSEGMSPIADPLHHTSFPNWLVDGFLNPDFPALYERFLDKVSERYPWVARYTVMNEPLPTTLFCSYTGMWYPHRRSEHDFVAMALRVARAISLGTSLLVRKNKNVELVYVSTAEHHCATDDDTVSWAEFTNRRRFLMLDLILGRLDRDHPLQTYFEKNDAAEEELGWLIDNPASFDTLGLDYYLHSEMDWFWNVERGAPDIRPTVEQPRGFASIAQDYEREFDCPLMLSETNIRGTIKERITWLKLMEEQCEQLARSARHEFRGFCWYPSIDSTDWSNACTRCTREVDPQGIWGLDATRTARHASELSQLYGLLAQGEISSKQIPAYPVGDELAKRLDGYAALTAGWGQALRLSQ